MGLEIKAFSGLRPAAKPMLDEEGYVLDSDKQWRPKHSMEVSERDFPGRGKGIDANTTYEWQQKELFLIGPYSMYSEWRDNLEKFVQRLNLGRSPFHELIHFSDCEGVIGPVASKRLRDDFVSLKEIAQSFGEYELDDNGKWYNMYETWLKIFTIAADNGAVSFE